MVIGLPWWMAVLVACFGIWALLTLVALVSVGLMIKRDTDHYISESQAKSEQEFVDEAVSETEVPEL